MEKKIFDPVCGMELSDVEDSVFFSYEREKFVFCSEYCLDRFKKDPEKFQGEPFIKLRGVRKIFKMDGAQTEALRGLDLNIWKGDFTAIIGASGSGKSTALNMMGLLDRQTDGKIFLDGKNTLGIGDIQRARLRSGMFGFVFQQYNLIPWLTAYENAVLPLIFAGKRTEKGKMEESFRKIGLGERMDHRPFELSGGEQQRVALLRALANGPEIILGDEPTGNLDSKTGGRILEILIELNKKGNKTLVIVTHDADIAEMADQVITLKDGRIVKDHHAHKKIYTE